MSHAVLRPRPSASASRPTSRRQAQQLGRGPRRHRRLVGLTRLTVLVLVIVLVIWAGARVAHAAGGSERLNGTVHVVQLGDTVWSIVVAQYGSARHDVRQLVDEVEQVNRLDDGAIVPGDRLRLPYGE